MKLTAKTIAAAILAAALMASVAALGQAASTTPSASQYQYGPGGHQYGPAGDQYGKKITICHKGRTIRVSRHALRGHKHHHDMLGPCAENTRKHHHDGHDSKPAAAQDQTGSGHKEGHDDDDHGQGQDKGHGQGQDKGHGQGQDKGKQHK